MNEGMLAIIIFTIVANLTLGTAVFVRNPKSATNRIFGIFAVVVAIWTYLNYRSFLPGTPDEVLSRIRHVLPAAVLSATMLFLLARTYPSRYARRSNFAWLFWVYIIALMGFTLTPFVYRDVTLENNTIALSIGGGFLIYAGTVISLLIASFVVIFKKFSHSTGRIRNQLLMFLLGMGIMVLALVVLLIIVNALNITDLAILAPFCTLILALFLSYAIIRYRFLDIRLIIVRVISYLALVVCFAAATLFASFLVLHTVFPGLSLSSAAYWFMCFLVVTLALIGRPLVFWWRRVIGVFFSKRLYKSDALLFSIMHLMSAEVDFDLIALRVLESITSTISISKAAILLVEQHRVTTIKNKGFDAALTDFPARLEVLEDLFHRFAGADFVLFDDIEDAALKEVFRAADIEIVFPITSSGREIALLVCGPKAAGDTYNTQDVIVLRAIADRIGENIESTRKFTLLKALDRVKSDFIASISHEFRTPLTQSRWRLESLLGETDVKQIPHMQKELSDMYFSMRWLIESIDQSLLALEFEAQAPVLMRRMVSVEQFIQSDVITPIAEAARIKHIALHTHIEQVPDITLDSQYVKVALNIVLENAIKYSPTESTVSFRTTVRTSDDARQFLRIEISNQGSTIDPQDMSHLFSKFYRGSNARTAQPNGLGLGLYIAEKIVNAHNGRIWAESRDHNTTFFIELPYAPQEADSQTAATDAPIA